jgi:hypothetical protein
MPKRTKNELASNRREELFALLQARFEANMHRHTGVEWVKSARKAASASGQTVVTQ